MTSNYGEFTIGYINQQCIFHLAVVLKSLISVLFHLFLQNMKSYLIMEWQILRFICGKTSFLCFRCYYLWFCMIRSTVYVECVGTVCRNWHLWSRTTTKVEEYAPFGVFFHNLSNVLKNASITSVTWHKFSKVIAKSMESRGTFGDC